MQWTSARRTIASVLTAAMLFTGNTAAVYAGEAVQMPEETIATEALVTEASMAGIPEVFEEIAVSADEGEKTPSISDNNPAPISPSLSNNDPKPTDNSVAQIEVNQGFGRHVGLKDGQESLLDTFVAGKETAVMMKIPGSDAAGYNESKAQEASKNYTLEARAVNNGQVADNCELTAAAGTFSVQQAYTRDCTPDGWYAVASFDKGPDKGVYQFVIKDQGKEVGKLDKATFYETKKLNILTVPVKAYWSASYAGAAPSAGAYGCKDQKFYDATTGTQRDWSELTKVLKEYLLDVYPIAEVNFEEGQELQCGTSDYDMVVGDSGGQRKLWEEACKLQTKTKDGKDRYDLILAFVLYRQDQGGGQGYTFGKPTNIITYSDKDMLPTVAHEIAHCYQVGDEYDGGSFNADVNFPPNGYKGTNYTTGAAIEKSEGAPAYWQSPKDYKGDSSVTDAKKDKVDENGAGTMVKLSLHPYSLSQKKFIKWACVNADGTAAGDAVFPTISWMGSGYPTDEGFQKDPIVNDYYWTNPVIWDHLLKEFATKSKKTDSQQETQEASQQTNAEVFANAVASGLTLDENSVFADEEEFYYDDDYRFGESRMVEVYGWMVKDAASETGIRVEMNPMFSYDGDLETMEPLNEIYKDSEDVYTFVALGADGKILRSPIDKNGKKAKTDADKKFFAATEFFGGFFNPSMPAEKRELKEINFNFDAEYPEDTQDFAIVKGRLKEGENVTADGTFNGTIVWRASVATADEKDAFTADFTKKVGGQLLFADINDSSASVEWEVYYPDDPDNADPQAFDNKNGELYTEVYYCPEGDDGESYYIGCSDDEDWREGFISFAPADFVPDDANKPKWTRNAYVWIKVTNGVNAVDIYSDENEISLSYSTIKLSGAGIQSDENGYYCEYTGKAITPAVTVTAYDPSQDKSISMKKDVDYSVTYENNINVGYATVTVQGIGSFAGKNTAEFEIIPKTLAGTPEQIPDLKYSASLDNEVVKYLVYKDAAGNGLVLNTDFTVKFKAGGKEGETLSKLITENPKSAVEVTVTYTGKGNYESEDKKPVTFQVLPAEGDTALLTKENTVITLKNDSLAYTGKALKPAVKEVVYTDAAGNSTKLKPADYQVVLTNNVNVGTGRVTVIGAGNYAGASYTTFTVTPKPVTSVAVSGLKNQNYTGSAVDVKKLPIVVKAGGIILTRDVDYTIEATGNLTDVTTPAIKKAGNAPAIEIRLIQAGATTKASEMPRVAWKNGEKSVKKTFAIVKTKFNSSSVTLATKSSDETKNIVKDKAGKQIGTMRSATKQELTETRRAYAFVISGEADNLEKDANLEESVVLRACGTTVASGAYTIKVSAVKNGKIGTITLKPAKGNTSFSGTKKIKFLYEKLAAETGEPDKPET